MGAVHSSGLVWSIQSPPAKKNAKSARCDALEVVVAWGDDVLSVRHFSPPREFVIGDGTQPVDFVVPPELGVGARRTLVGKLGDALAIEPAGVAPSVLLERRTERVEIGELSFAFRLTEAESARFAGGSFEPRVFGYFSAAFACMLSLVGALSQFTPPLGLSDDEDLDRDRLASMLEFLNASAERERSTPDENGSGDDKRAASQASESSAASAGTLGKPESSASNHRFASNAAPAARDTTTSRAELVADAQQFGLVGLLSAAAPKNPGALWDHDGALNSLDRSAFGTLFGEDIGEARGTGGLGPSGPGLGGGGKGVGIGLDGIGTCQLLGGCSNGPGRGIGNGGAIAAGGHTSGVPRLRAIGSTDLSGTLPAEVVQRVVRQNFGRFRNCYEDGLRRNPSLNGRVTTRFVIDRSGAVSLAQNGGSDLPDGGVVACVVSAFYSLSFPAPDNGVVRVSYPIMFSVG